jgi:hypothetical protein
MQKIQRVDNPLFCLRSLTEHSSERGYAALSPAYGGPPG